MEGFAILPAECWRNIFRYCPRDNKWTLVLQDLARCQVTSKTNQRLFSDEYLLRIFSIDTSLGPLKDIYIRTKIKNMIKHRSIDGLKSFVESIAREKGTRIAHILNQYLFYALKHVGSFFRAVLTKIEINGKKPAFATSSLIKAIEHTTICYNNGGDNETMLVLLPLLVSKFHHVDPSHVNLLKEAVQNKQTLNTGNDIFHRIQRSIKSGNSSTQLLLELLKPSEKKIIVPEGTLIRIVQELDKSIRIKPSVVKIVNPNDPSKCVLQYRDHKAKYHEITLPRDPSTNEYSYDDYRSSNIYDMIVSTKIGQEIFGAFPQQLVAVTEEALDLPLEKQPWFFCNLNDTEISHLLDCSTLFITVSYGSKVYLHWSNKHGYQDRHWQSLQQLSAPYHTFRNILGRYTSQQRFIAGIYNKGDVKNQHIYQFYCCVARGDLKAIKKFHKEHNINLSHLTCPNILHDYLLAVPKPDENVVDWLLENGCTGIESFEGNVSREYLQSRALLTSAMAKCKLSVAITLLERKVIFSPYFLYTLFTNHMVSFDTYMTFWNKTNGRTMPSHLLEILFGQLHKYKSTSHANKTLIMCAWQFGNEDNYFKMVPKDIMNEIISYGLDEPEWYKIADHIMEKSIRNDFSFDNKNMANNFAIYAPYIVKNYKKFIPAIYFGILKQVCDSSSPNGNYERTAHWISKLSQVMPSIAPLTVDYFPNTLFYCLENELQLPMVKALMECGFITKEFMSRSCPKEYVSATRPRGLPPAWVAVISKNKAAVKYLCSVGAMPLVYITLSLHQVCVRYSCEEMFNLVVECLNNSSQNIEQRQQ